MTTAASMTYDSLSTDLPSYLERTDTAFAEKVPDFIMLAENRIAADLKQQGFVSVVKGNLVQGVGGASMAKPAFWRETISFTYKDPVYGWQPMRLRSLEYVKNYWPIQASVNPPRFYADYNAQNFYVAPSPDQGYPFELSYYARLQPLDSTNQTNWLTLNAPQALLAACIVEAYLWAKNTSKAAEWDAIYENRKGALIQENQERLSDRTEAVTRA
jgi:hypothetical protein